SDVPIDVADLVAGDVFAQLFEIHAAAFEMAEVSADHGVVDEPVGADFDAADGFEEISDGHGERVGKKLQASNSKLQRSTKLQILKKFRTQFPLTLALCPRRGWAKRQAPSFKLQRSSKLQIPNANRLPRSGFGFGLWTLDFRLPIRARGRR